MKNSEGIITKWLKKTDTNVHKNMKKHTISTTEPIPTQEELVRRYMFFRNIYDAAKFYREEHPLFKEKDTVQYGNEFNTQVHAYCSREMEKTEKLGKLLYNMKHEDFRSEKYYNFGRYEHGAYFTELPYPELWEGYI